MADQKKWFKVWASILTDPKFQSICLEDMARWVLLGAMICQQGENGKLTIIMPANWIFQLFRAASIEDLKVCFLRLPHVQIQGPINDNGDFIVIMQNWFKYQVDSTAYDRVKRSRYKKRGEEKRSLTSTSTSTSTSTPRAARSPLERGGATRETAVKAFEEAADNELCGPPKNMWSEVEKKI